MSEEILDGENGIDIIELEKLKQLVKDSEKLNTLLKSENFQNFKNTLNQEISYTCQNRDIPDEKKLEIYNIYKQIMEKGNETEILLFEDINFSFKKLGISKKDLEFAKDIVEIYKKIESANQNINNLNTIESIDKLINELILFQAEKSYLLGDPTKTHIQQDPKVLKNKTYWEVNNTLNLLNIRKEIVKNNYQRFASFSVGGSIGAGHLGFLLKDEEKNELPEVIFGASAGSLFPTLYLLWQKARKINPEKAGSGLEGIFQFLPEKMEGKTMWTNGEELIEKFANSGQYLIDIINEKSLEKLPNIKEISIGQISPTLGIIASRTNREGKFQEIIFSGRENLMSSIIASSNPKIKIFGIDFSVLTTKQNKFYNNEWSDGFHTNANPLDYGTILGVNEQKQYISFHFLQKSLEKTDEKQEETYKKFPNNSSIIPDLDSFLDGASSNHKINHYKIEDQNDGWGGDEMKLKIILSYYTQLSSSNFGYFIGDIEKNIKSTNLKNKIFNKIINKDFLYVEFGNIVQIKQNIELLNSFKFLTNKEKRKVIKNIFYQTDMDGTFCLQDEFLQSSLLPNKIDKNYNKIKEDGDDEKEKKGDRILEEGPKEFKDIMEILSATRLLGDYKEQLRNIDKVEFKNNIINYLLNNDNSLGKINILYIFIDLLSISDIFEGVDKKILLKAFMNGFYNNKNHLNGLHGKRIMIKSFFDQFSQNERIESINNIITHLEQNLKTLDQDESIGGLNYIIGKSGIKEGIETFNKLKNFYENEKK